MSQEQGQDRLQALEEELGFAARKCEQLDETVRELSSLVYELSGRLERLERKLRDLAATERDPEADSEE